MSPLYQLSPDANASPQVSSTLSNGGAERQTEVSERVHLVHLGNVTVKQLHHSTVSL